MPGPPARTRAGILVELQSYCSSRGLKIAPLVAKSGLDPACLDSPNMLVPLNATLQLFDDVALALGDPNFGISFARQFSPGASGLAGALIMSAPTVRDAMVSLAELVCAYSPQVEASFGEKDGIGHLRWSYPDTLTAPRLHYVAFSAASIVMRVREGTGTGWCPLAVEFDHRAPKELAGYVPIFGERLKFEMPVNRISIDAVTLGRTMKTANPALFAMAIDLAQRWIASDPKIPDVVRNVRTAIAAHLTRGAPSLEIIARSLGLTVSQLQWRLEQAGTTFEKVLNGIRADLAENLLKNSDKSITDIAFALGFTDPSAFTRAARRWFSDTPLNVRRKARRGESTGRGAA